LEKEVIFSFFCLFFFFAWGLLQLYETSCSLWSGYGGLRLLGIKCKTRRPSQKFQFHQDLLIFSKSHIYSCRNKYKYISHKATWRVPFFLDDPTCQAESFLLYTEILLYIRNEGGTNLLEDVNNHLLHRMEIKQHQAIIFFFSSSSHVNYLVSFTHLTMCCAIDLRHVRAGKIPIYISHFMTDVLCTTADIFSHCW
jgi:hypothetical protein